jgi:hypothetical protein
VKQPPLRLWGGGGACSVNTSVSLDDDREPDLKADPDVAVFPFPLSELEVVSTLLQLPKASVHGIWMPRDISPVCHTVTSMLSSVGIYFSSCNLAAWSKKIGMQSGGG